MIIIDNQIKLKKLFVYSCLLIVAYPLSYGQKCSTKPMSRHTLARFKNLKSIREQLGWEVLDLVKKLENGKPSGASIYRLEQGRSIRLIGVTRIFNVLNDALGGKLQFSMEIEVES